MISKKKYNALNLETTGIMNEVLEQYFNHDIGGTPWYNTPPEMWMSEEKIIFDALSDMQQKFMDKLKEIV